MSILQTVIGAIVSSGGGAPPTPSYSVGWSGSNNVNEGDNQQFNVGGTNIPDDTYYWTIETNAGDFATTSGTVSVTGNSGTFTVTPTSDDTTEGAETFTVALRSGSITGTILATSSSVTINDTSLTPTPVAPFSLDFPAGNPYLLVSNTQTDWNLGTTYTIEYWSKSTNASTSDIRTVMSQGPDSGQIDMGYMYGNLLWSNSQSLTPEPTPAVWTHVAWVRESGSGNITLYYNGVNQTTFNAGAALANGGSDLNIGRRAGVNGQGYLGKLAMIRVSTTAKYLADFNPTATYGREADTRMMLGSDNPLTDLALYELNGITTVTSNGGTLYFSKATYPDLNNQVRSGDTVVNVDGTGAATSTTTGAVFTADPDNWGVNISPSQGQGTKNFSGTGRHPITNNGVATSTDFPTPPTYTVTPEFDNVDEGASLTFTVGGTNINNGTYYWTVNGSGDFDTVDGTVTITSNTGSFTVTPTADATTEGAETFTARLRLGSITGTILATSEVVTINDTSLDPPVAPFSLQFVNSENDYLEVAQPSYTVLGSAINHAWSGTISSGKIFKGSYPEPQVGWILIGSSGVGPYQVTIATVTDGGATWDLTWAPQVAENLYMDENYSLYDPALAAFNLGSTWTIEFWLKANAASDTANGGIWGLLNQVGWSTTNNIVVALSDNKLVFLSGSGANDDVRYTEPTPGQWTHVAIVNDEGTQTVWYNGVEQTKVSGTFGTASYTNGIAPLRIGRLGPQNGGTLNGKMAMIRISGSAMYAAAFTPTITYGVEESGTKLFLSSDTPTVDSMSLTVTNNGVTQSTDFPVVPASITITNVSVDYNTRVATVDFTSTVSQSDFASVVFEWFGGGAFDGPFNLTVNPGSNIYTSPALSLAGSGNDLTTEISIGTGSQACNSNTYIGSWSVICLVEGTMITMADGSHKAVEDVGYNDLIRVWNFDLGEFSEALPVFVKREETHNKHNRFTFSDGTVLRTVGHHVFNKQAGAFTMLVRDTTPVGTITFNEFGEEVTLISKETIQESVRFYNVWTQYHLNLFADGILTSNRFNNIYPIRDMKFVKDARALRPLEEFANIDPKYIEGLRLQEQPAHYSAEYIRDYVENKLERLDVNLVSTL
jgi:hypothetical protein